MGAPKAPADRQQGPPKAAACYLRMSTDHQRYSIDNQRAAIDIYAAENGLAVVSQYADAAKSGLTITGRKALSRLINDVQQAPPFATVLVYDVSRWGRFQDVDESAYYEYICRRAGVEVIYCAEPFGAEPSPANAILKALKRAMAAEYSRELSTKVFIGQARLAEDGFRMGGMAGYGLRRLLVDKSRMPKANLAPGERKSLQTDRVILVRGPEQETTVVRQIFRAFLAGTSARAIAAQLNRRGLANEVGAPWTDAVIGNILRNDKYVGHNVFNRTSQRLSAPSSTNSRAQWIRADNAFEPIVDQAMFDQVQQKIAGRLLALERHALIARLKALLAIHGTLNESIVRACPLTPSPHTYRARFGTMGRAFALAGLPAVRDEHALRAADQIARHTHQIRTQLIDELRFAGAQVELDPATHRLIINREMTVEMIVARCSPTPSGARRWRAALSPTAAIDLAIVARMNTTNSAPIDFLLLPSEVTRHGAVRLSDVGPNPYAAYRFDTLGPLIAAAARSPLKAQS